ncbi:hypothetical protein M885DRAFT_532680 [Pelagophyceae sp. CCMP2097]|nr:hypothetical protein M885DRAFT_532680 [Pelagophyceae sp. CCMP2097]
MGRQSPEAGASSSKTRTLPFDEVECRVHSSGQTRFSEHPNQIPRRYARRQSLATLRGEDGAKGRRKRALSREHCTRKSECTVHLSFGSRRAKSPPNFAFGPLHRVD